MLVRMSYLVFRIVLSSDSACPILDSRHKENGMTFGAMPRLIGTVGPLVVGWVGCTAGYLFGGEANDTNDLGRPYSGERSKPVPSSWEITPGGINLKRLTSVHTQDLRQK